jgi:hypothetical protein
LIKELAGIALKEAAIMPKLWFYGGFWTGQEQPLISHPLCSLLYIRKPKFNILWRMPPPLMLISLPLW